MKPESPVPEEGVKAVEAEEEEDDDDEELAVTPAASVMASLVG